MGNVAQDVIWPSSDEDVLVRAVYLYVGQGDATIFMVKDGDTYRVVLVDINRDEKNGGIDVPKLMEDLLEDDDGQLVFCNTHPHSDHLRDIEPLSDEVDIHEVWHSGHKPSKDHNDAYKSLQKVIKKVKKKHGDDAETELRASSVAKTMGDGKYFVLWPDKAITDEIADEKPAERSRRIHEQCAVLKFGDGSTWAMQLGDADRDAFEKNLMKKPRLKAKLKAQVLGGSHHGSDTFFKYSSDDEAYKKGLKEIDPTYVVISAPKRSESPHNHPDKDAMSYYEEQVASKDDVLHTGKNRKSFICDIFSDGEFEVRDDKKKLANEYGISTDDDDGDKKKKSATSNARAWEPAAPAVIVPGTRVDEKPMG